MADNCKLTWRHAGVLAARILRGHICIRNPNATIITARCLARLVAVNCTLIFFAWDRSCRIRSIRESERNQRRQRKYARTGDRNRRRPPERIILLFTTCRDQNRSQTSDSRTRIGETSARILKRSKSRTCARSLVRECRNKRQADKDDMRYAPETLFYFARYRSMRAAARPIILPRVVCRPAHANTRSGSLW